METREIAALCPSVEAAFGLLAKKWTGLIFYALSGGERFFCELEKVIPDLSARLLTLRLRELEVGGFVTRTVSPVSPVRVSYRLTDKGLSLAEAIGGIAEWATRQETLSLGRGKGAIPSILDHDSQGDAEEARDELGPE